MVMTPTRHANSRIQEFFQRGDTEQVDLGELEKLLYEIKMLIARLILS